MINNNKNMNINSLEYFFKIYSKYPTFPLIIFLKLLFEFFKKLNTFDGCFDDNLDYQDNYADNYVDNYVDDYIENQNNNLEKDEMDNIIIPTDFTSLNEIINNQNIFIRKIKTYKYLNDYTCILARKFDCWYGFLMIKIIDSNKKIEQIENFPNYIIYMKNLNSNQIFIDMQKKLILENTLKTFKKYNDLIPNILAYSSNYNSSEYIDMNIFFENWTKPIEPTDKENYEKLIKNQILTQVNIKNGIKYTDIVCYRNLMQKDFKSNLDELYKFDNNELQQIPYLFTTYRENSHKQIIMILH